MKVISWNLLRLTGAAVEDVAALIAREKPDLMLMQEATQPHGGAAVAGRRPFPPAVLAGAHPRAGRLEPAPFRGAPRAVAAGLAAARPPAAPAGAARAAGRHHLRQRPSLARPAAEPPSARAHRRGAARQALGDHRRLQHGRAASCCRASPMSARASRRTSPATSCRSGSTAAWCTASPVAPPPRSPSDRPTIGRSGSNSTSPKAGGWARPATTTPAAIAPAARIA